MVQEIYLPNITIIGCGYVGLTTAALLANSGYKVSVLEINPERLKVIKSGRSFFFETGLDELLSAALGGGSLVATDSYSSAIPSADIVFSCVGTPDNPDGSSNLSFVFDAAKTASKYLKKSAIFVQKSTVPVGTGEKVIQLFDKSGRKDVRYVSNPEFLREGTAIADSLWPDRVVAGSNDRDSVETILNIYKHMESKRQSISKISKLSPPKSIPKTQFISTNLNSAELIKVTANAFLALKISFANSIAKLADQANANVVEVMEAVGSDNRIGKAFLNAGRGYGGGCFPKDVSGLIRSADEFGVDMEIMNAATAVNDSMPHYVIHKAETAMGGTFAGKSVTVLGLAFKAGTSDARRSPAIEIANTLMAMGATVRAYDPVAGEEARAEGLSDKVMLCDALEQAVNHADCIFIATDWPEFVTDRALEMYKNSGAAVLFDAMNCLPAYPGSKYPVYLGVGLNQILVNDHSENVRNSRY